MFAVKRNLSKGRTSWYLRYRDETGRLINYPKAKYPEFKTQEQAKAWIVSNREKFGDIKKQGDLLREIERKREFPEFQFYVDVFIKSQKIDAPNSWKSSEIYMERFVFDFFLIRMRIRDINEWLNFREEFRDFLLKEATVKGKKQLIKGNTRNNIIRTFNKFISIMARYNHIRDKNPPKCRSFPKHMQFSRGYDDIYKEDELIKITDSLNQGKDFFRILSNTGMRFGELFGLSVSSINFADDLPKHLKERFDRYEAKIFGYILLESQLKDKTRSGSLVNRSYERKPLKSCKDFNSKNRRVIPIFDEETWNTIVRNYNHAWDLFESGKLDVKGPDDILLLQNVELTKLRSELRKYTTKGFHACRHTYITNLVGRFMDITLTRMISGHKSDSFEVYVHIYQRVAEEAAKGKGRKNLKEVSDAS
jgi:integrase